jgi:exopolysaccharide biosynthesis glucuronosyltransferase PssD
MVRIEPASQAPEIRTGKRVLAIASGGGHWIQLQRLKPAFEDHDVYWVAADGALEGNIELGHFFAVQDANRDTPLLLLKTILDVLLIVLRIRPQIVLTTGAAPGLFGIVFGKLVGARTMWIDSVANAEELSMSGRLVRPFADIVLTQWSHLAGPQNRRFEGAVL